MSTNITDYAEKSIFGKDRPECQNISSYPTATQFYEALNGYAIALYTVSCKWSNQLSLTQCPRSSIKVFEIIIFLLGLVTIVLACQFFFLVRHFFLYVPASRRVATLWVNSVYLIVSIATVFCVILPQSSDFVWLFYRVYLGMAMGYFVDLTLAWYGGESEMLRWYHISKCYRLL